MTRQHEEMLEMVKKGSLDHWKSDHHAALAYLILCSQISRIVFKGTAKAYMFDPYACKLAKSIIADKDRYGKYRIYERLTIILSLLNSESQSDAKAGMQALRDLRDFAYDSILMANDIEWYLQKYEQKLKILATYKRYPDRNPVLGRKNKKIDGDYLARSEGPLQIVCNNDDQYSLDIMLLLETL